MAARALLAIHHDYLVVRQVCHDHSPPPPLPQAGLRWCLAPPAPSQPGGLVGPWSSHTSVSGADRRVSLKPSWMFTLWNIVVEGSQTVPWTDDPTWDHILGPIAQLISTSA
ncbi:unnamed protein product [Boreogadus saida]